MLEVHKILLPVEFDETSLRAVGMTELIARYFQSEIVVLHVVDSEGYPPEVWKAGRAPSSDELLAAVCAHEPKGPQVGQGPRLDGMAVKCLVRQGDASSQIIDTAAAEQVDLIVMPTHGHKGFYSHLIGSVTAKVIHESEQPVLTGTHFPENRQESLTVRHVVCGVTFNEHSLAVLKCAGGIAAEFQAKLTVAHVTPDVERYGPGGMYADRGWKQELVRSAEELIAKVQKETGVVGESAIESGDPSTGLDRIAGQVGADLLVVGGHYSGGHQGTNIYGILAASKIPMLSL